MKTLMLIIACLLLTACAAAGPQDGTKDAPDSGTKPYPGSDGTPVAPFGGFDYATFQGDHLVPTDAVNVDTYEPQADGGYWQADFAAMAMLARYYGHAVSSCALDTVATDVKGLDCCDIVTSSTDDAGDDAASDPDADTDADTDAGTTVSCGHTPETWKVGAALASAKLRGLWTARPLTVEELRTELANGRPVLIRTASGTIGDGALVIIAGWSPIEGGGDRFLLVREGVDFHWVDWSEIIEHRDRWTRTWTDSWYRISATVNGCVPTFDAHCGH